MLILRRPACSDICDDIRPVGDHYPAAMMVNSAANPGSESAFRMYGKYQSDCTELWNSYFDKHNIDFVLTPSTWADAETNTTMVRGDGNVNVKQLDGSCEPRLQYPDPKVI
eukprot:SAG31_NODE_99_length_25388_cov_12.710507_6_plen_111_part_00